MSAEHAVIGGGFTGLRTALQAKEADLGRDVVLLEGRRVAWAGSGRNGGFCSASLTHGLANGQDRFPGELATLERPGRRTWRPRGVGIPGSGNSDKGHIRRKPDASLGPGRLYPEGVPVATTRGHLI